MIKYAIMLVISLLLIGLPIVYLMGNPWGAVPSMIGIYGLVISLGELLEPFNRKFFRDDKW